MSERPRTTINMAPWKGPAKSKWTRCQGQAGHSHGCNGATGGFCFTIFNALIQPRPPRAIDFIRVMCSSASNFLCSFSGITALLPHNRHPSSTVNSCFLLAYGCNGESLSTEFGQPCLLSSVSFLVDWRNIGKLSICERLKILGSLEFPSFQISASLPSFL